MATGNPSPTDNLKKSDDTTSSFSLAAAIKAVQELPDVNDDLIFDACDLLSSENNSEIFIALDAKTRRNWLKSNLPQHRQMQIFVEWSCGKKISLEILSSDTIADVKMKIQVKEGVNFIGMLIFDGWILEDGRTVADYGLLNGSELHMCLCSSYK